MRSIILAQSLVVLMFLSGCASLMDKLAVSYDLPPKADSYWVERNPPTAALNRAEVLAVQSAAGLIDLKRPSGSTYYEGHDNSFTIVRFEKMTKNDDAYVTTVKYRIRSGLIFGETIPSIVAMIDPQKEEFARQVAFEAVNGTTPAIPVIYDGRMFIAKNNTYNSCTVEVVEKDLDREYFTYRVKTC